MERCLYEGQTFLWTFIVGHLVRLGSRNAMDANRNDPKYADAILKLADQSVWPEGERKTAPCTLSCCNFLSRGCTAVIEKALVDTVSHMIRLKLFENARFRGLFVIAVDGTKQERIRCCKWLGNRANRYVLEAKLVTPWGSAYSVMSVPIKPWHDRDAAEKQDREYRGFLRLAPLLKAAFPHLGICILGDGLYACKPIMELCESYGWEYIFTFKEGRTPTAFAEARDRMEQTPSNSGTLVRHDAQGRRVECGRLAWARGVEIANGADDWHVFNVVRVSENDANGAPYEGQFATSLEVACLKDADDVCKWGRRRWDAEESQHDPAEVGGGHPSEATRQGDRPRSRRTAPQVRLARVPDALNCNGRSGGPQNASDLSPSASRRVACHALNRLCGRVSSRKTAYKCPRRLGAAETRGGHL